ncbi:hypothetical protein SAY86_015019 [Trapa natans]|uniref:RING-type E3 ubiquitin transferase n=1 Tax=Trapa natans TaxID=22666 RepID=A0AAN7QGV6_TRANT|nr:hypothetical protein SAY86_015019 [Trapa natans]
MELAPTAPLIFPLPLSSSPPPPLPPPFLLSSQGVDLSPLEFFLVMMAAITIPLVIYTLIFAIKCPCSVRRRSSSREIGRAIYVEPVPSAVEAKLRKGVEGECPVCLSAFGEGEEVKQLIVCGHYFHEPCIDTWLRSHASCPICRAPVAVKRRPASNASAAARNSDHVQGLPDASSLV